MTPGDQGDQSVLVVDLARLGARDLNRGGGKAANLGELLRAGFPVPPGFVITTAAYDLVVRSNDLQRDIANASQPRRRRPGSGRVRTGDDPAGGGTGHPRRLSPPGRRVRRRPLERDRRGLAGGGVRRPAGDIPGGRAAKRRCSTPSAAAGRRSGATAPSPTASSTDWRRLPVKLAVIVQRMVAADVAGVMFTANPVTGARDETIVEASAGLGEALVSGLVTPDHVVLRNTRHRWQIVDRQQGRREVEVRPRAGGGVEQVAAGPASGPALPDAVLLQLARMGASIARHFGRPQDIEWAWADGKLYILQSRPITALPEPPSAAQPVRTVSLRRRLSPGPPLPARHDDVAAGGR